MMDPAHRTGPGVTVRALTDLNYCRRLNYYWSTDHSGDTRPEPDDLVKCEDQVSPDWDAGSDLQDMDGG